MANSESIFAVYGDEDLLVDRHVEARKQAWKGRQIVERDGDIIGEGDLISLLESRSLFDDSGRAIILENAQDLKVTAKGLFGFLESRDPKNKDTFLLAVFRDTKVPAAWKPFLKNSVSFSRLKVWEKDKAVNRILEEAKLLGLSMDRSIAESLQKYLGNDLRKTVNELKKISFIVNAGERVTREHVSLVFSPDLSVEPWDVASAAMSRNAIRALRLSAKVFRTLDDGAAVPIVASLMRYVEQALVTREMLDKGDSPEVIAVRLGMHEYACKMNVIPLAQGRTVPELRDYMKTLCRLDALVKGAARSKRTLVELAVLAIAAP